MSKRKNHSSEFQAKVASEALKSEQTVAELPRRLGVHPTMIHNWKRALVEGATGVFERGGKKAPEIYEEQVKELHAKIAELSRGQRFFVQKAGTVDRLWRRMKYECVYQHARETGSQTKAGVGRWVDFYNRKRAHSALGGQPPAVVHWLITGQTHPDRRDQRLA